MLCFYRALSYNVIAKTFWNKLLYRRMTRNFLELGSFLGIRALRKTFTYNTRKKGPAGKKTYFSPWNSYKFHFKWKTLAIDDHNQSIFLQIRVLFSSYQKKVGKTSLLPPLVTRLLYYLLHSVALNRYIVKFHTSEIKTKCLFSTQWHVDLQRLLCIT